MSKEFRCFQCDHINVIGKETKPTLHQRQQGEISDLKERVKGLESALADVCETLIFYGDVDNYFALAIVGDSPCGEIAHDHSEDHNADYTDRPLHGAKARETIKSIIAMNIL